MQKLRGEVKHMEPLNYEQRGYLKEDFRLFHLADDRREEIGYHYHGFHKIIILLAGQADYAVEGEVYALRPGDCVLVGRGTIHRPVVAAGAFYERMILYISPEYLRRLSGADSDLESCFRRSLERFRYVYHSGSGEISGLFHALEQSEKEGGFGSELLRRAIFLQLMVAVNRVVCAECAVDAAAGDGKIVALLQYLNAHLTEPLGIDELAGRFYLSKYHMMRRFKQETGYTIHNYITEKRLLLAQQLLQHGRALTETAFSCGYQDYSTFSRAYKKRFGRSPSDRQHDLQI